MYWKNLTQPQATLLGSIVTAAAALFAVWLGAKILDGKVKGLERAISISGDALKKHLSETEAAVRKSSDEIKKTVADWSATSSEQKEFVESISEQVVNIANEQANLAQGVAGEGSTPSQIVEIEQGQSPTKEAVRSVWGEIQDAIEAIARAEKDGRTRAKYARKDRRSYYGLIDALEEDGKLSRAAAEAAREALTLRNVMRRRVEDPTQGEWDRLQQQRNIVVASVGGIHG